MKNKETKNSLGDSAYSLRRYYVDRFLCEQFEKIPASASVLDIGGHKDSIRGNFSPYAYGIDVTCVNISDEKGTDIISDATLLPIQEKAFDIVLCSELIEHVYKPHEVLEEIYRVLKPGGKALLTIPLHYHIHGDPQDYGRYTYNFLEKALVDAGFTLEEIKIRPQGKYWSVLADFIRMGLVQGISMGSNFASRLCALGLRGMSFVFKSSPKWDAKSQMKISEQFTTGYEVIVIKTITS